MCVLLPAAKDRQECELGMSRLLPAAKHRQECMFCFLPPNIDRNACVASCHQTLSRMCDGNVCVVSCHKHRKPCELEMFVLLSATKDLSRMSLLLPATKLRLECLCCFLLPNIDKNVRWKCLCCFLLPNIDKNVSWECLCCCLPSNIDKNVCVASYYQTWTRL